MDSPPGKALHRDSSEEAVLHSQSPRRPTRPVLNTSFEDLEAARLLPSSATAPPYRIQPSPSSRHLNESFLNSPYSEYPPSPAYRSRVDMRDDESNLVDRNEDRRDYDEHPTTERKVHYRGLNDDRPPSPIYHNHQPSQPFTPSYESPRLASGPPSTVGTDEEDYDEESDYDWSGDDDLIGEEAKLEERFGVKAKKKGWSFKRIVTILFSTLIGSTFLAGILVTPAILIHFFWYKPHPNDYRLRVKNNVQAWLFWAAANLTISWCLAFLIDLVPGVVLFLVSLVWGHISERTKSRVELYNSVKNTIKPAFYMASGWLSWVIIFAGIFHLYNSGDPGASEEPYTKRVYQVLMFLFFLVLVFCVQKMLSHAIAFQFHWTAFRERLDELTTALRVIEKLRVYRPKFQTQTHSKNRSSGCGWRTPLWGTTPTVEKDYFEFGTGTSKGKHSRDTTAVERWRHSKEATIIPDADSETEKDVKGKKRASGSSWLVLSGRRRPTTDDSPAQSPTPSRLPLPQNESPESSPRDPTATSHTPTLEHRYPPSLAHDRQRLTPSSRTSPPRTPRYTEDATETLAAAAKALKTAVLHDARNIKGEDERKDILGIGAFGSTTEAKRLARSIYYRYRRAGRKYLLPSDFAPAFPFTTNATQPTTDRGTDHDHRHHHHQGSIDNVSPEALAAFRVFDKDNNGDISRAEIKTTLIRVYKERRALARSMRDVNNALESLDWILMFFAAVIVFFISLQVFGVEVGNSLASVYSLGIAASFVFKNAASNAFDAVMFLFVTHPFDTGDRVFIGDQNLVVKKMGLFATVFTRSDGTETYFFNSQLFNMFITNIRRSGKQFENCTLQIAWKTPLEKIDALESCMNSWLSTEENRWFEPATSIMLQNIKFQRYLEITISMGHNGNWQDWGRRVARKTAFHTAVAYYCRQLGIVGYEAPLPVVWADDESGTYDGGLESPSFLVSPLAYSDSGSPMESRDEEEEEGEGEKMGATLEIPSGPRGEIPTRSSSMMLGFRPPESTEVKLRARKSKGRKAIMRGMDA
ncbi:hypothetical protein E1B28_004034 [Marasmius oreades]|uniref:EF-hand domain-containing protein n=1 Tax=Marasmius oreades TaxID=181124 RepID=A0A9P7UXT0_9AGAR|nr:uncharacterized protein E1B28_004034 [Marasmius oreades]KAG7096617.1 hypothetical protein E1B28_004034 [Marasmius oreades]